MVRRLLQAGASVTACNAAGETALIRYASLIVGVSRTPRGTNSRMDAFQILLDAGSDVNAKTHRGTNALHALAACHYADSLGNRLKAAKLLVDRGVDVDACDEDGKTALDLLDARDEELRRYLLSAHRSS